MLNRLYGWYGKRVVQGAIALIILLVIVGGFLHFFGGNDATETTEVKDATVIVQSVRDLGSASLFSTIGTVEAVSEAKLQTEKGGRITSVRVEIGDRVAAGTVLASIENASEQAALLQAEGAYDAAVANARQSEISEGSSEEDVENARISGWNTYRNTFINTDVVLRNTLDPLFSETNRQRLDLDEFNWERRMIRYEFEAWAERSLGSRPQNVTASLTEAESKVERLSVLVDQIYEHVARKERTESDPSTEAIIADFKTDLAAARSTLNGAKQSLASAQAAISNTAAAYERAQLSSTGGEVSLADASVKQALGSLRAAQANYEKTLVRSPISGLVNALYLKAGDYVSPSQPAAIVANNDALEIRTAVSEEDSVLLSVGDPVSIENTATGTITAIAPAVDPSTGKIAVKISIEKTDTIENGRTVAITFGSDDSAKESTEMLVPLAALKITPQGPRAFSVSAHGILTSHPVTVGTIRAEMVVIEDGLTLDSVIVTDARGLKEGQKVTVVTE